MSDAKVAIVTAAGGGMGAAIATELHARGYRLALMSRSDKCERLAQQLDAVAVRGDTAQQLDLMQLIRTTLETYGRIDAVVNHTGHPPKGELLEFSDETWHDSLDLLLLNVVRMARLVTPVMQAQGGGVIVNITTFATLEPELIFPISCTLRAGLASFTKLYADRYAKAGIRMNCLLPGFVDSLNHKPEVCERIPLGRIGNVEEIAKTTAFLLSDDAGYITGQNIRVDGGVSRHV
jgi:NAD(P)-dependent dehydrogenase (short-subunit alcohol dehydrogenase family)